MDRVQIGKLLAQVRLEKGLTQKQLAERLHISDRTVSKWERGAGLPDISLLEPLAESLDLTVEELLQGRRQESREFSAREWKKWLEESDRDLREKNALEKPRRKRRALFYAAEVIVTAAETFALAFCSGRLGVTGQDLVQDLVCILIPLIFGLWAFVLWPEYLPAYYDVMELGDYYCAGMRLRIGGVRFNNRNWPHILRAFRWYCFLVPVCWPLCCAVLYLTVPDAAWMALRLPVTLAVILGGLFVPIVWAARKYA